MENSKETRKSQIVKLISQKPMSLSEIGKEIGISKQSVCNLMAEVKRENQVISAKINPNKKQALYFSIGINPKSVYQTNKEKIIKLISEQYMTITDITRKTGLTYTYIKNTLTDIKKIHRIDKVFIDAKSKLLAYGIGLEEISKEYSDLPKKISDVFLLDWVEGRPEFYNKSTKQIIEKLKKQSIQVFRYKPDGGVYYL